MTALKFAPRDTKRDAAKRKRLRRRQRTDKAYMAWLHTQPCIVTGRFPVTVHHEPPKSAEGGSAWSDYDAVPLIPDLHVGNNRSRHGCGSLELFEAIHGVSVKAKILELRGKYLTETKAK